MQDNEQLIKCVNLSVHGLKILKNASTKVTIDCHCDTDKIKFQNESLISFFNSLNIEIEDVW